MKLVLAIIYTLVIVVLSLMPKESLQEVQFFNISHFDKIVHFGMYLVFYILWFLAIPSKKQYILFFTILFGVAMEFCQVYLTTGREFDVFDIVANACGALIAYLFLLKIVAK